jgi:glycosyltransferase involved in cell wall biosynthesis
MRIGLIAPPWIPVPPPAYGGTEEVIDNLARGLTALGHDVRLFTVGESTCPVPHQWLYRSPTEPIGDHFREAAHVLAAYQALADTEIIHDHTELGPRLAGRRGIARQPVVTTVHGPVTAQNRRTLAEAARLASIVAISHSHARSFGDIPVAAVIHHGIDLESHKPGPGTGGYLLFVGRMSPDKGVHHAVRVARQAGWPLVITAKIREPAERDYFDQQIRPLLGPGDDILGEQPLAARVELMRHAAALLNPITWPEPFGLVMAQALATATPVLAFPNGAAPEIIDHGRTGYLCRDEDEMTAAVAHVHQITRGQCRAAAERRFSLARMAADYERLYRAILEHPGRPAPERAGTGALDHIHRPGITAESLDPRSTAAGPYGCG